MLAMAHRGHYKRSMIKGIFRYLPVLFCTLGLIACSQKGESGSEIIIKFDGGTVTMDEINKRAGLHLEQLRKRESEIRYRAAVQVLMDKIHIIEAKDSSAADRQDGRGTPEKTGTRPKDLPSDKNNPKKDETAKEIKKPAAVPEGEDLQKVFVKYNVQNNLKKPE